MSSLRANPPPDVLAPRIEPSASPPGAPVSLLSPLATPSFEMSDRPRPHPALISSDSAANHGSDSSFDGAQRVSELETQLEHRERQIEAMRRVSDALFAHSSVDDMVRETLEIAIAVSQAEAGSLQMHDPDHDTLVFRYVIGPTEGTLLGYEMPASQGIAGQVFRTGIPDLTHQAHQKEEFNATVDETTGFHTHSMMTVPVKRHDGDPIGVMQVLHDSQNFDARDLEVLSVLCDGAASAIEQARLQDAARQAQIVSLLGDISHDIKNMLTPLSTGASTLQWLLDEAFTRVDRACAKEDDPNRALAGVLSAIEVVRSEYGWILGNAQDGADRVQARTREIADAIKGEVSPPYFECAPLSEVIYEVARSLTPVADKAGVKLYLDIDSEMPHVEHDRKMLYNALYNLVNNAIPETSFGGSITIRASAPDEKMACLEVSDTGRGMPLHVRERLFTDSAISTKPGGTGLGTRIVAGVVKQHHGTITVQSEESQGTTFTMLLPLRRCHS